MRKILFTVGLSMATICYSCQLGHSKRNHLDFNDDIKNVSHALFEMNKLLHRFPKSQTILSKGYSLDKNVLEINGLILGNIDSIKLDTVRSLSVFDKSEQQEFAKLAKYLSNNHITGGAFDKDVQLWLFGYRTNEGYDFDEARMIGLLNQKELQTVTSIFKVVERNGDIYLLANKNARIY